MQLPGAEKDNKGGNNEDVRKEPAAKGTVKSRIVRVIEWKKVERDDPIEYFFPWRVLSTS